MGRTLSNSKASRMTCHQQRWGSRAPRILPVCCLLRGFFGGSIDSALHWLPELMGSSCRKQERSSMTSPPSPSDPGV